MNGLGLLTGTLDIVSSSWPRTCADYSVKLTGTFESARMLASAGTIL
jgi:hypothetical protein